MLTLGQCRVCHKTHYGAGCPKCRVTQSGAKQRDGLVCVAFGLGGVEYRNPAFPYKKLNLRVSTSNPDGIRIFGQNLLPIDLG